MGTLLFVAGSALALGVSTAADIEVPWWGQLLIVLAGGAGSSLIGLAGRALNKLFDYLAQKTRIAKLAEVDEAIMGFAADVYQGEVAHAKAASADGKLSPDEIARFKVIPIEKAKEHFGVSWLGKLLGDTVDSYLASRVERAVVQLKTSGKAAASGDKIAKAVASAVPPPASAS